MWALQTDGATEVVDLLQYGVLGAVLIALILGWLWAKPAVAALMAELEAARDYTRTLEEIRRLLASIDRRLDEQNRK